MEEEESVLSAFRHKTTRRVLRAVRTLLARIMAHPTNKTYRSDLLGFRDIAIACETWTDQDEYMLKTFLATYSPDSIDSACRESEDGDSIAPDQVSVLVSVI